MIWQVRSMEEAVEWVKRCPNPREGESEVEIRHVFEVEDFGGELSPVMKKRGRRLRAQIDAKQQ